MKVYLGDDSRKHRRGVARRGREGKEANVRVRGVNGQLGLQPTGNLWETL